MIKKLFYRRGVCRLTSLVPLWLVLALASCGSLPVTRTTEPDDWAQTRASLSELKRWHVVARLAIQTETQGGSLDMFWSQADQQFTIKLIAPLGQGAMQLKGNADWVVAKLADGSQLQGKPDELMRQYFEVSLPVDALGYWLRGMTMPAHEVNSPVWNGDKHLHTFIQHGWRVEMLQYRPVDGYQLPHRFYLEPINASEGSADGSGQTSVRVIISRWQLVPA